MWPDADSGWRMAYGLPSSTTQSANRSAQISERSASLSNARYVATLVGLGRERRFLSPGVSGRCRQVTRRPGRRSRPKVTWPAVARSQTGHSHPMELTDLCQGDERTGIGHDGHLLLVVIHNLNIKLTIARYAMIVRLCPRVTNSRSCILRPIAVE